MKQKKAMDLSWNDLFTAEEAVEFVRLYEPRLRGSFGELGVWRWIEVPEDTKPVLIQKKCWKAFLCRVSHKEFRCWEDMERPENMVVQYETETFINSDLAIPPEPSELLERFKASGSSSLTLFFQVSRDEKENALPFRSSCNDGSESEEDEN